MTASITKKLRLSSILFAAAAALAACGGGSDVTSDDNDVEALHDVDEVRFAAASFTPGACDTQPADASVTLKKNSTVRKSVSPPYGTGPCRRYMLDVKNKGSDGLPIIDKVDVALKFAGSLPTNQLECVNSGIALSFESCTSTTCDGLINNTGLIPNKWNGTSCSAASFSRGVLVSAKTYRLTANGTNLQDQRQAISISFTAL